MKRSEDEISLQNVHKLMQEKLKEADPKLVEDLMSQMKSKSVKPKIQARSTPEDFEKFIGFWQSTSAIDQNIFLMEFYLDDSDVMSVRYFTGTSQNWREFDNVNDFSSITPSSVSLIDSESVLLNVFPVGIPTPDQPYSTFRIQEDGSGIIYFFDFQGVPSDLGSYKYEKLEEPPVIQRTDEPSLVDWNDPVKMAEYVYQYYGSVVGPQKANDLNDANYVGRQKYDELFQELLTTGWTRTATTSSAFRGGKYIGVWKTQFPDNFPVTTLHTSEPHKFNMASLLEISGFSGAYSILNGEHRVSLLPSSSSAPVAPYPWADQNSFEYLVMVDVDTSSIVEDYNPLVHGYGELKSIHEAVTSDTEYRSMIASLFDFVISSFGETTHNRFLPWVVDGHIPETFEDLNLALQNGTANNSNNFRMRSYQTQGDSLFYHNYPIQGNSPAFPTMNINDPFGLGDVSDKPEFDIDIDVENYLQEDKRFNLFYTITGDPLAAPPLTSILTLFGLPSNGNKVVFQVAPFGQVPEPLEDEWGTHPYFYYGFSGISGTTPEESMHDNFVCGIMKKSKTKYCETVAYIRFRDENTLDGAGVVRFFPDVFSVEGLSNTTSGNETVAMATVLAELNKYNPSKYILDSRTNNGGATEVLAAWAQLFGGNRSSSNISYITNVQNDNVPIVSIAESGYESGNNNLQNNNVISDLINTDEAAALFPESMVRSNDPKKKKQVVFLTSIRSASSGDAFPHCFIGPDATSTVHDLGFNVESTIVSDINGRLDGCFRGFDAVAVDFLNGRLTNENGQSITPLYLGGESCYSLWDRIGPYNNFTTQVIPDKLLETWYDNVQWRDIGLIEGKDKYPLCGNLPKRSDNTTWRDYILEEAIAHRSQKKSKCHCKSCKKRHCKKRC